MFTKETRLKIKACLDYTSAISGILTFLTTFFAEKLAALDLQNKFINIIIQYKTTIILAVIAFITLRYMFRVIPNYKVIIQEVPRTETSPSSLTTATVVLTFAVLIPCSFIATSLNASNTDETEETQDKKDLTMKNNINQVDDEQSGITMITEDELIEYYILESESEEIPEVVLKDLSKNELYYIRNGIFAYEGLYFESGYYNRFSWYKGNIYSQEEVWGNLNYFQYINVQNIIRVEQEMITYK